MNKLDLELETILLNTDLDQKDKEKLVDFFSKISINQKMAFVALVKGDISKLKLAIEFIDDFKNTEGGLTEEMITKFLV
jgi:Na+/phosphate symporter